jgi:glycosyltransferase involved in cell wall biosynthesis
MNNAGEKVMNNDGKARPITLFTHGRLEPGKGLDTLVKAWKELQVQQQNAGIKLIIA